MGGRVRYACEWTTAGIGVAAQRSIRALLQQPDVDAAGASPSGRIGLAWEPLEATANGRERALDSSAAAAWLRALRRPRSDGETLIQHSVPGEWRDVAAQLQPTYRIGHSVWELDDLPTAWIDQMAGVDEFWVPTEWNRDAFERALRRPVHVVPHVTADVTPAPTPMNIPADVAVVSVVSAWDWRKRPDRAIEAFCRAFTSKDPVVLAVKTTPWHVGWPGGLSDVAELIHRITEQFPDPPTVHYSTEVWTDEQMAGLAERSICTLSLSASEGWGLGTFDAAVLGIPAIITGFGGQTEYLGDDYPGLLPYRRVRTVHEDRELFEFGTEWAHADMDAAVDLLRSVVDGSATALVERAGELAAELRERYSPAVVGAQMVGLLSEALDRSSGASSGAWSRSSGGLVVAPGGDDETEPGDAVPSIVILTPVKNASHHAVGFVDRILSLEHPAERLRVAVLASDSTDGTADAFRTEFLRLSDAGIESAVHERDFGFVLPDGVPRWAPEIQLERRLVLARSRNHLLSRGLGDADWALWIDVDVVSFPSDVITRLLDVNGDVVQPHCLGTSGATFDRNAWTDQGRHHFDDYAGTELVELHAVGGTMLLVRADRHRDGLTWPAYRHGAPNPRVRRDPASLGRDEIGEVETEGLAMLAYDMGISCWGLPDLHIHHE
jgi:glycosyltransferase involved in cell wall biosynthesis